MLVVAQLLVERAAGAIGQRPGMLALLDAQIQQVAAVVDADVLPDVDPAGRLAWQWALYSSVGTAGAASRISSARANDGESSGLRTADGPRRRTCVYTIVVFRFLCPSSSWTVRMS